MNFNTHSELAGQHAFLSASQSAWVNYTDEKLIETYQNRMAAAKGTELHEVASQLIKLGIKLPNTKKTMNLFVNDAIGYRMSSEQVLFYSYNAFGTADAISYRRNPKTGKMLLRIYDLKTGIRECTMRQLIVYVAYFCLEYDVKPGEIEIDLRLYQNDAIEEYTPTIQEVVHIMDRTVTFDRHIDLIKMEA